MLVPRDNFEGKKVVKLEYEAYESMALKELNK
jgi:molybdopterin synthase catalytic subunit